MLGLNIGEINHFLGRKIYGNSNSFVRNYKGQKNLKLYRKAANLNNPSPNNDVFDVPFLKAHGYAKVGIDHDATLIKAISEKTDAIFSNPDGDYSNRGAVGPDGETYSWHINKLNEQIPEIIKLLTPELIATLQNFYGCYLDLPLVQCWRNVHAPQHLIEDREVFNNHWHCDGRIGQLYKCFYLINDIGEEEGPFAIKPKDVTQKIFRKGYTTKRMTEAENEALENNLKGQIKFTGKAGDMMMAGTAVCLHKASNPAPGKKRDIVCFTFVPSETPLPDNWSQEPSRFGDSLGSRFK